MAIKFLDPGGDATFNSTVKTLGGLWDTLISGSPDAVSDFVHGNHQRSIRFEAGTDGGLSSLAGTLQNAGNRISLYIYITALPGATATFAVIRNSTTGSLITLRLTSGGVLQVWNAVTGQIGSNGSTLSTGQWYRISIAFTLTSTTINRIEVFKDGVSDISITNATLTAIGASKFAIGNHTVDSTFSFRASDIYIDDNTGLTDTGDIWVTAKRPKANGATNEFTTQIGSGGSGYGTGHSPQINERAYSATNGWSISTTTKKTEQYTIEGKSEGDIDITYATIIGIMGWIASNVDSVADSPVHKMIIGGVEFNITQSTTGTLRYQDAATTTYPSGNDAIGATAQYTTTPHLTRLFECGILVAYIPATVSSSTIQKSLKYAVIKAISITKSLKYTVKQAPSAITKSLKYTITKALTIQKSLTYRVAAPLTIQKALKYTVKTTQGLTKSLKYSVFTPISITKSARYAVKTSTTIQKSLRYDILATTTETITKNLRYAVVFSTTIQKSLRYAVAAAAAAITKALKYTVKAPASISKSLTYAVTVPQALTKSLTYKVTVPVSIQKSLTYRVVQAPTAISKSLRYAVIAQGILTKVLRYMVSAPVAITKSLKYVMAPQTFAITKSLTYRVKLSSTIQKSLTYAVRPYPYRPKPAKPYGNKASPFSSKASPFTRRSAPYSKKGPPYSSWPR